MLTIEIPKSTARESEEDVFAKAILQKLNKDKYAYIYCYGGGYIQMSLRWGVDGMELKTPISNDAFDNVIRAFRENGYSISYGSSCPGYSITIIRTK